MRWNKSTRFALYAAMEMVRAGDGLVTAVLIANKYHISVHHMAKVLQQLARVGIVQAVRGVGGGYRLAKNPKEISLLEIVEVFEGPIDIRGCLLTDTAEMCGMTDLCRLKRVFDEIEQQAFFTLKSIRLSTLVS